MMSGRLHVLTSFTRGTIAPITIEYEIFLLFPFIKVSVLFEWYRMKKQTSVKINGMPSLNDPRSVAEAKENVKVKFVL